MHHDPSHPAASKKPLPIEQHRAVVVRRVEFRRSLTRVRQLAVLRFEVSRLDHDPDFMLFVGVASESDHLPPHELRSQCAPAWLDVRVPLVGSSTWHASLCSRA
ncbi:hypothetical protein VAPA_1c47040 [Variovorax paradoxus B4]|uniref:Uncharacterized protein n=1 Tax=Variovorax paradoxus B4 TaxID=1246301 RepID=T1XGX5_VARPD|nr:hypothetical protein VAPA_1c47040 [Variovorax paradoxus B4]